MPRLMEKSDMEEGRIQGGNFTYTGTRLDRLGASEYTLVTIAVDESGSVSGFNDELRRALVSAVESCKRSPRSNNLLVRVVTFGSQHAGGVNEVHGFKLLSEIDPQTYPPIVPGGVTPLYDAVYSSVGAMNSFGKKLSDDDYGVNAIAFVITDGAENASVATVDMVADVLSESVRGEVVESMVSVLIGINSGSASNWLSNFHADAGITHYVDAGEASKQKLAKLAAFVSQSVSSQSMALGTGGPSQQISATI